MFVGGSCGVVTCMNTRALHEPDTDSQAHSPEGGDPSEAAKGTMAGVVTPVRMGIGGLVLALVAVAVVVLIGRSRRRSKLTETVLHLPGQVESLVRRGADQLAHVVG
jgi:hypothetical protein